MRFVFQRWWFITEEKEKTQLFLPEVFFGCAAWLVAPISREVLASRGALLGANQPVLHLEPQNKPQRSHSGSFLRNNAKKKPNFSKHLHFCHTLFVVGWASAWLLNYSTTRCVKNLFRADPSRKQTWQLGTGLCRFALCTAMHLAAAGTAPLLAPFLDSSAHLHPFCLRVGRAVIDLVSAPEDLESWPQRGARQARRLKALLEFIARTVNQGGLAAWRLRWDDGKKADVQWEWRSMTPQNVRQPWCRWRHGYFSSNSFD